MAVQSLTGHAGFDAGVNKTNTGGVCGHVGATVPIGPHVSVSGGIHGCISNPLAHSALSTSIGATGGITVFF